MVLRYLLHLVAGGYAKVARAIFLVRGHTKNDCDRLFNIMKKEYRKTNVYTPKDIIESLDNHEDITAKMVNEFSFLDWDKVQNIYLKVPVDVKKNHVFTCYDTDPTRIHMQEYHGAPTTTQTLLKKNVEVDWWKHRPPHCEAPGLQDVKWIELHKKWGPLIPEEKKKDFH